MNLEEIRKYCLSLPGVTEDIKWDNDLVFSVAKKMFCATCMDCEIRTLAFKVADEQFEELSARINFKPAPYLARARWILIEDISQEKPEELKQLLRKSYILVRSRLTRKIQQELPPFS